MYMVLPMGGRVLDAGVLQGLVLVWYNCCTCKYRYKGYSEDVNPTLIEIENWAESELVGICRIDDSADLDFVLLDDASKEAMEVAGLYIVSLGDWHTQEQARETVVRAAVVEDSLVGIQNQTFVFPGFVV